MCVPTLCFDRSIVLVVFTRSVTANNPDLAAGPICLVFCCISIDFRT